MTTNQWVSRVIKPVVFLAGLGPLLWLVWGVVSDGLGVNPVETVTAHTGTWTLRFIVVTLAITPLRRVLGWNVLIRFRRMAGLFAFFYGTLHFLTYLVLDQNLEFAYLLEDVARRPFITAGFTALVSMLPLALTSTTGMIRRLGGRRWQQLHRLVYLTGIAAVVHYLWLVKIDITPPLVYGAIVAALLAARVLLWAHLLPFRLIGQGRGSRLAPDVRVQE